MLAGCADDSIPQTVAPEQSHPATLAPAPPSPSSDPQSYSLAALNIVWPVEADEEQLYADCNKSPDLTCQSDIVGLDIDTQVALDALTSVLVPPSDVTVAKSVRDALSKLVTVIDTCVAGGTDAAKVEACASALTSATLDLHSTVSQLSSMVSD
jgi:hypothetical protein